MKDDIRYVFLDVETTGLSPQKGDKIIEIGCVEVINGFITGRVFHSYFYTKVKISEEAYNVHGIDNFFLKDKPFFCEKLDYLLGFIKDSIIIAHNIKFDLNFLKYEINNCGVDPIILDRICLFLDSLEISRKMYPNMRNNLDSLCERFKLLQNAKRDKHGALLDAWLLSLVVIKMGLFE